MTGVSVILKFSRLGFYYHSHKIDPNLVLFLGHDQIHPGSGLIVDSHVKFFIDGPGSEIIDALYVAVEEKLEDEGPYRYFKCGIPRHYMVHFILHVQIARLIVC